MNRYMIEFQRTIRKWLITFLFALNLAIYNCERGGYFTYTSQPHRIELEFDPSSRLLSLLLGQAFPEVKPTMSDRSLYTFSLN